MAAKLKSESTLNQYDYEPEYKPADAVAAAVARAEDADPVYKMKADARRAAAAALAKKKGEVRYSEDQPRDDHGRFGAGDESASPVLKFDEWKRDENTGDRKLVVRDDKTGAEIGHIQHDAFMEEVMGTKMPDSTIRHVYVDPAYRKQGVGERLYREAIKDAKSLGFKRLVSDTSVSKEAQGVWKKLRESGDLNISTEKDGLGREQWVVNL